MHFKDEPNIDQLDQPALVAAIEAGKRRIEECEKTHETLDGSLKLFGEAIGISKEMARLERVIAKERVRIQAALARLSAIDPEHPLAREYHAIEPSSSQQATGWRACLRKLFSFI